VLQLRFIKAIQQRGCISSVENLMKSYTIASIFTALNDVKFCPKAVQFVQTHKKSDDSLLNCVIVF
jgi:hypothetical protein